MKIICSFYIGHQDYLAEVPALTESESNQKLTAEVSEIAYRNIGREQFEIYSSNNLAELNAVLRFNDEDIHATGFSTETAIAEDEEGLPVLFYLNVHFEVPNEYNIYEDFDATLKVGSYSFDFRGLAEIEDEE